MASERLDLPDDIAAAIARLAIEHEISTRGVIVRAVRMYHDANERMKRGATCRWSDEAEPVGLPAFD